jgi:hypothetical protein
MILFFNKYILYLICIITINVKINNMYKFEVGDKVYKPKGYKFPGTVVSIFKTTSGETRIVAEMEDNGMLHIFNENQLEKKEND